MKKILGMAALAASALTVFAVRTEDVRLWRGEKYAGIIHDHVAVGDAPEGFTVKIGVAKEIRYLTRRMGTHYATMADRVVWGSDDPGVKVASVEVSPDVKPGEYLIGDLKVTVVDRVLPSPKDWKYHLDLWQHPWAVARYFNVEPFTPKHYAAMRPLWEQLADAGSKTLTATLLDLPWNHQCYDPYHSMIRHIKCKDGSWKFDYRVFDEYVTFGRSCGLGPEIACYTMCPWDYAVTWENEDGDISTLKAVPGTPEFADYWGDFLVDFARHLKAKGWFEATYICMDERSPEDVRNICSFVQAKAPGLKVSLTGNRAPSQFGDIRLDLVCFGIGHLSDELLAEASARRAKGMLTTFYVCCGPSHPNTMCLNEREEAYWLGAYPAMAGLDGFLRWAWNSWPQDPMNDASYTGCGWGWPSGDTYLVYPDNSPSLRFLELRNGIVAAEKVRILREKGLFVDELKALAAKYNRREAIANKTNFEVLRSKTQELVNR